MIIHPRPIVVMIANGLSWPTNSKRYEYDARPNRDGQYCCFGRSKKKVEFISYSFNSVSIEIFEIVDLLLCIRSFYELLNLFHNIFA